MGWPRSVTALAGVLEAGTELHSSSGVQDDSFFILRPLNGETLTSLTAPYSCSQEEPSQFVLIVRIIVLSVQGPDLFLLAFEKL